MYKRNCDKEGQEEAEAEVEAEAETEGCKKGEKGDIDTLLCVVLSVFLEKLREGSLMLHVAAFFSSISPHPP